MTFSKCCQSGRFLTQFIKNWSLFLNILKFKILVISHVFWFFSSMIGTGGGVIDQVKNLWNQGGTNLLRFGLCMQIYVELMVYLDVRRQNVLVTTSVLDKEGLPRNVCQNRLGKTFRWNVGTSDTLGTFRRV